MREFTDADMGVIDIAELVAETARCLADLAEGSASQSPKTALPLGVGGFFLSVAGVVPRLGLATAKWASYAPGAPGAPGVSTSTIIVSDAADGRALALVSGMRATHLRTAATAAAGIRRWQPEGTDALALVGFGPTNRTVLEVLERVGHPIHDLRIAVRSAESAERVRRERPGATVTVDVSRALRDATLAVLATGSSAPIASAELLVVGATVLALDGLSTWRDYAGFDVVDDRGTAGVTPFCQALGAGPVAGGPAILDIAGSAVTDVALVAQLEVLR